MKIQLLSVSARSKNEMEDAIVDYQDRIEEHLFKLYAYGNLMPENVRQWVKSLNSYMYPLMRRNIGKGNKQNVKKEVVLKRYVDQSFSSIDVLKIWNMELNNIDENYKVLEFNSSDLIKIRKLATLYVESIFSNVRFEPPVTMFRQ
jgi:hypothetical protein